jgi:ribulose-5-phosphate 4-epimerase/fuculose-1-phosphate aldolase
MLFHGRTGYHDSDGLAPGMGERQGGAAGFGNNAPMISRNHGTLVAGGTVAETFSMTSHLG